MKTTGFESIGYDPDPFCAMVESDEEVTITRAGNPVAVVIPVETYWRMRNALDAREQSVSG